MKALISPNEGPISYVASWTDEEPIQPIRENYPNSARVAQIVEDDKTFPLAEPMFWTDCSDDAVADRWWCDVITKIVSPIINEPRPAKSTQP